jgi:hypothetical protein
MRTSIRVLSVIGLAEMAPGSATVAETEAGSMHTVAHARPSVSLPQECRSSRAARWCEH